jgi:hypothetical protein
MILSPQGSYRTWMFLLQPQFHFILPDMKSRDSSLLAAVHATVLARMHTDLLRGGFEFGGINANIATRIVSPACKCHLFEASKDRNHARTRVSYANGSFQRFIHINPPLCNLITSAAPKHICIAIYFESSTLSHESVSISSTSSRFLCEPISLPPCVQRHSSS